MRITAFAGGLAVYLYRVSFRFLFHYPAWSKAWIFCLWWSPRASLCLADALFGDVSPTYLEGVTESRGGSRRLSSFFFLLLLDFLLFIMALGGLLLAFLGFFVAEKRVLNVNGSMNMRSQLNSGRIAVNRMEYPSSHGGRSY